MASTSSVFDVEESPNAMRDRLRDPMRERDRHREIWDIEADAIDPEDDRSPLVTRDSSERKRTPHHWRRIRRQFSRISSFPWSWTFAYLRTLFHRPHVFLPRTVYLDGRSDPGPPASAFPLNVVCNQKYTVLTFVPVVLYEQFRFFFNLYFLIVALSQIIPALRVGYLFTYVAPLSFVLGVTMLKEWHDDYLRWRRDKEANGQQYSRLTATGTVPIPSSKIKVGDLIVLKTNQRVPADLVMLRTSEKSGSVFIRTDQLDGETDWKLRHAVNYCQKLPSDETLLSLNACIQASQPSKEIYDFVGTFKVDSHITGSEVESLGLENTLWANTVIASGMVVGVVIYTGKETRSVMNTSLPTSKVGLLDSEINLLSKMLFALCMFLALVEVSLKGYSGPLTTFIYFFRFMLLFSSIIPISTRINLDMGKMVYSVIMERDKQIQGTLVRNSTIPEELGRIQYLLSDKTGTLTQNDMIFKKLHLGPVLFSKESLDDVRLYLLSSYSTHASRAAGRLSTRNNSAGSSSSKTKGRASPSDSYDEDAAAGIEGSRLSKEKRRGEQNANSAIHRSHSFERLTMPVREAITALALCHNVTPVRSEDQPESPPPLSTSHDLPLKNTTPSDVPGPSSANGSNSARASNMTYQASSPDEVALVKFTESVGMVLERRTLHTIGLRNPMGDIEEFDVLHIFPFTSASKRMGIIVRERATGFITFYLKGADVVMSKIVQENDWLEEECGNMARDGLRTLVFGKRRLSEEQYMRWLDNYNDAKASLQDRAAKVEAAQALLEVDLHLLVLTGVEDKLQENVRTTLETVRNAGIKIWMLTGDKVETAACIAVSSRLVSRNQSLFTLNARTKAEAAKQLHLFRQRQETAALVIDGSSLQTCLDHYPRDFMDLACKAVAVVCCRCSPTQKAEVVSRIRQHTNKRTCAIGDGGNDVSMIQAADVGVGIVGKEGMQASLAADFSITRFANVKRLLLWHGRNSYTRSARLSQFVFHRGLIIAIIQAVFSACFYFAPVPIYQGWLMVGYATYYTMMPVFSLVLDEDVTEKMSETYPELYRELQKGRSLSLRTFFTWVFKAIYQGSVIMLLAIWLFEKSFVNIVAITFTSLVLTELLMVALEVHTWHRMMIYAEIFTVVMYFASMVILRTYFDISFLATWAFVWKVVVITLVSCVPVSIGKFLHRKFAPPAYVKLV